MTDIKSAREQLLEALIEDKKRDAECNPELLLSFIREGFPGFESMSNAELVRCARDAGMDRPATEVAEWVETLSSPVEAVPVVRKYEGPVKRVIAVVTYSDPTNDVETLSDAATWLEVRLKGADVTCYGTARDAALDEKERAGDFAVPAEAPAF